MSNTNMQSLRVVGIREEKFVDNICKGDYEFEDAVRVKHFVLLTNAYGAKFEAELSESSGMCGSGYTTASWGHFKLNHVSEFMGITHRPMYKNSERYSIELEYPAKDFRSNCEISNSIFSASYDGGDGCYPMGGYSINLELFMPIEGRYKEKRPVWIFYGGSALGKSYLSAMTGKTKYETDKANKLPNSITEDIVVIGNKYQFTIEEITEKLFGDCEVIPVKFG